MRDTYETPFNSRYASKEMQYLFSAQNKVTLWRKLWIILAESEQALGLPITMTSQRRVKKKSATT